MSCRPIGLQSLSNLSIKRVPAFRSDNGATQSAAARFFVTKPPKAVKSVNHTASRRPISSSLEPTYPTKTAQLTHSRSYALLHNLTTSEQTIIAMSAPTNVLHLRAETKPLEHRSALTPSTTKALIEAGYTVNVERDEQRIFDDEEFEAVGAKLVPTGSWVDAPKEHIIVGLKELEEKDCESPNTSPLLIRY